MRAGDSTCRNCGVNLALAAVLAERHAVARPAAPAPARSAEVPRFGEFLVSQGLITPAQLQAALARQLEAAALGARRTIGQTLLQMGCVTQEQLDLASATQVRQLQQQLEASNRELEERVNERTRALQNALQKLSELQELKASFVASISHELRTPLVPIRGYSDLLATESLGSLNDTQREAVRAIGRSTRRLEALVNELIQYASSVTGRLVINRTLFAACDLAERLWDYFGPRAAEAGVSLQREVAPDLPLAHADAEKIYWVLFQLLDNALKFTPPGGEVRLSAAAVPPHLRLSVRDTGAGIAPEQLPLIFQPFRQGVPADDVVDGTGLGLALVKRILEAHGSRIEVDSRPGEGSLFSFELQLAKHQR